MKFLSYKKKKFSLFFLYLFMIIAIGLSSIKITSSNNNNNYISHNKAINRKSKFKVILLDSIKEIDSGKEKPISSFIEELKEKLNLESEEEKKQISISIPSRVKTKSILSNTFPNETNLIKTKSSENYKSIKISKNKKKEKIDQETKQKKKKKFKIINSFLNESPNKKIKKDDDANDTDQKIKESKDKFDTLIRNLENDDDDDQPAEDSVSTPKNQRLSETLKLITFKNDIEFSVTPNCESFSKLKVHIKNRSIIIEKNIKKLNEIKNSSTKKCFNECDKTINLSCKKDKSESLEKIDKSNIDALLNCSKKCRSIINKTIYSNYEDIPIKYLTSSTVLDLLIEKKKNDLTPKKYTVSKGSIISQLEKEMGLSINKIPIDNDDKDSESQIIKTASTSDSIKSLIKHLEIKLKKVK